MRRRLLAAVLSVFAIGALPCCSGDPIRVGALVSSSGAAASVGQSVRRGMELGVERVNDEGGVRGRVLEVLWADDATSPDVGLQRVREMVEQEHVEIVLGAVSSAVTLRLAGFCEGRRVLLLSPTAGSPQITEAGSWVFRVFPSETIEATAMADLSRDLGCRRVATVAIGDADAAGLVRAFVGAFEGGFRRIAGSEELAEGDPDSRRAAAERIAARRPQAVYLVAWASEVQAFVGALREAGWTGPVLASSFGRPKSLGPGSGLVVYPVSGFDAESRDPVVSDFVGRFRERWGEPPDRYAAHGYDAVRVLATALGRERSVSADSARDALLGLHDYNGASGRIAFDANGDVARYPGVLVSDSGREVPYVRFVEGGGALEASGR